MEMATCSKGEARASLSRRIWIGGQLGAPLYGLPRIILFCCHLCWSSFYLSVTVGSYSLNPPPYPNSGSIQDIFRCITISLVLICIVHASCSTKNLVNTSVKLRGRTTSLGNRDYHSMISRTSVTSNTAPHYLSKATNHRLQTLTISARSIT
jgi:hypothetical protein